MASSRQSRPKRVKIRLYGAENEFGSRILYPAEENGTRKIVSDTAKTKYLGWLFRFSLPPYFSYRFRRNDRVILLNQGQCYLEMSKLIEHATAECVGKDIVRYETAGLVILARALKRFRRAYVGNGKLVEIKLYKTNRNTELEACGTLLSDVSFGSHGNYSVLRSVTQYDLTHYLAPFLKTRWCLIGNGWIDFFDGKYVHFLLSQRADAMADVSDKICDRAGMMRSVGSTTSTDYFRPYIHERRKPHAEESVWQRLHDISENANMSEKQLWLKRGTMDIVLAMIEDGGFLKPPPQFARRFNGNEMSLFFNADIRSRAPFPLEGGETASSLDVQRFYFDEARRYFQEGRGTLTDDRKEIMELWGNTLDAIERWDVPYLSRYLDWAAILRIIGFLFEKMNLDFDEFVGVVCDDSGFRYPMHNPIGALLRVPGKIRETTLLTHLLELIVQYADVETGQSPYGVLVRRGAMDTLFTRAEINSACVHPPENTRARLREEIEKKIVPHKRIDITTWDNQYFECICGRPQNIVLLNQYRFRITEKEKRLLGCTHGT